MNEKCLMELCYDCWYYVNDMPFSISLFIKTTENDFGNGCECCSNASEWKPEIDPSI